MATKKSRSTAEGEERLPRSIRSLNRSTDGIPRIIVYGEPGVGKTPFAASAPNALILDGDGGLDSALAAGSTAKAWSIRDWGDALEAYQWLADGGYKRFDWVVIDSLTLFQESGLDNIMDDLVAVKSHRSIYLPDKGEYGQNMSKLGRWLRDMKRLPIKQIWTAHAIKTEKELPDGTIVEQMMPQIQGKGLAEKFCGYVSVVAHLEVVESKKKGKQDYPVLITSKSGGWYGKDRYGAIGRMANPTVPKVMAAIEAKLDPSKAQTQGE